ncbi:hypothetical protein [Salipiger mangrovisoli]|uniref:Peptidoglycan binding domain-containing protein n=1 Tax=Salipiger mangrovisoli TaxID=2865933 RepID=A0ABR9WYG8_9RHOB|nr:hypothetical protein [Salipiger mangrovisoli]MBE9636290.1 hypothetical protein [Salipiger mangrovisoli]
MRQEIHALQAGANALGFSAGRADGLWGPKTEAGLLALLAAQEGRWGDPVAAMLRAIIDLGYLAAGPVSRVWTPELDLGLRALVEADGLPRAGAIVEDVTVSPGWGGWVSHEKQVLQGSAGFLVSLFVLHTTATSATWWKGKSNRQMFEEVRGWHLANGWRDIGYHGLIFPDGEVIGRAVRDRQRRGLRPERGGPERRALRRDHRRWRQQQRQRDLPEIWRGHRQRGSRDAVDPRIWYMPRLRVTGIYGTTGSVRHVPQPCIEPVVTVEAVRMSSGHAVAGRLVEWSAVCGRSLLVMAMGDRGSGLMNTEDWRSGSAVAITGGRMWSELVVMKAAVEALGPAHEIVGALWSMGANDRYNAGSVDAYDAAHLPVYSMFFSDVRALVGDIPMVLWNIGDQLVRNAQTSGNLGFGIYMQDWLARFDKDSGHSNAIPNLKVVHPQDGNQLAGDDDPHYNAHGVQQNGRDAGDALLALLGR